MRGTIKKMRRFNMKRISLFILTAIVSIFMACESAPKKTESMPATDTSSLFVSSSNEQLANFPVAGFGYKSSKVPAQKWDTWAKNAAPVVKKIVDSLPEGYVLQVTGHTDSSGPEEPVGRKPGNIKISSDRANTVYESLKRQGISSPNMTSKGVGSSDPLEGVDGRDPSQRRVTFKVVPKQ